MIRMLTGKIDYIGNDYIILNVSDVGYQVFMSNDSIEYLSNLGLTVTIYTYTYIKEDSLALYGFLSMDELETFELLISVNGIGPKGAINIYNILNIDELKVAICSGDVKEISKASGIGKKTAEKCIIELRDKINIEDILTTNNKANKLNNEIYDEAILALNSLGYSKNEASKALSNIEINNDMNIEDILREALKFIV